MRCSNTERHMTSREYLKGLIQCRIGHFLLPRSHCLLWKHVPRAARFRVNCGAAPHTQPLSILISRCPSSDGSTNPSRAPLLMRLRWGTSRNAAKSSSDSRARWHFRRLLPRPPPTAIPTSTTCLPAQPISPNHRFPLYLNAAKTDDPRARPRPRQRHRPSHGDDGNDDDLRIN